MYINCAADLSFFAIVSFDRVDFWSTCSEDVGFFVGFFEEVLPKNISAWVLTTLVVAGKGVRTETRPFAYLWGRPNTGLNALGITLVELFEAPQ